MIQRSLLFALALLIGCSAAPPPRAALPSAPPALPTITPQPVAAPVGTVVIDLPTPAPTALPTALPTPMIGPEGAVTWSMAALGIGGEPFATLGEPNAPVTMIEYSDFGCPSCRIFHQQSFRQIREQYIETGAVFYVVKDLPVVSFQGGLAGEAAACAGAQGQYWPMHRLLFASPEAWDSRDPAVARAVFDGYAAEVGLDSSAFAECLDSGAYRAEIEADLAEANGLRIFGTPAFFINGRAVSGALPYESFARAIEFALAEQP